MLPTDEYAAFLDRIATNPDADGPRMIFADWLGQHGESDWEQFIRLEIATSKAPILASRFESRLMAYRETHERKLLRFHLGNEAPTQPFCSFTWDRGLIVRAACKCADVARCVPIWQLHPINAVRLLDWTRLDDILECRQLPYVTTLELPRRCMTFDLGTGEGSKWLYGQFSGSDFLSYCSAVIVDEAGLGTLVDEIAREIDVRFTAHNADTPP
jgi:uncharacterized protein (TIGR02996 family)